MRRIAVLAGLASVVSMVGLTGCSRPAPSPPLTSGTIVVFAAASLRTTFTQLGEQFKTDNPGAKVDFEFGGSSALATTLTRGGTADVFASADTSQMDVVAKAGLLAGDPVRFAANTLVIVTAPGNPKKIAGFADLTKPGISVVVCQQPVPCGSATRRIETAAGVALNPVSAEPSVADVLNKITSGQADAGLVYVTDALNVGDKVTMVTFPEASSAVNVYPIAVLKGAPQPALAHRFVELVTGATGQKILAQAGFAQP